MGTWSKLLKGLAVNERPRCNFFNVAVWFSAVGTVDLYRQQPSQQISATKKDRPTYKLWQVMG